MYSVIRIVRIGLAKGLLERGSHVEERLEIFRGHFVECFGHFTRLFCAKYPSGVRGRNQAMRPISEFCGVKNPTVQRWLKGGNAVIIGVAKIKLICFLDLLGYRIIEFERLPRVVRSFSELVGFSILSSENAIRQLDYSQGSEIYSLFSGNKGMSKEK